MPKHSYTPQQALNVILERIRERAPELGREIQAAIDIGKDTWETDGQSTREFRKRVPFSTQEALQIAIRILQAHFVEVPMFLNSSTKDFQEAAIGEAERAPLRFERYFELEAIRPHDQGKPKPVEIELQTETQLTRTAQETTTLKPVSEELISEQEKNLNALTALLEFNDGSANGDSR